MISDPQLRELEKKPAWFTYDPEADAYYFAPSERTAHPYLEQREVRAILDIASDGSLAGVELVWGDLPPPPIERKEDEAAPPPQQQGQNVYEARQEGWRSQAYGEKVGAEIQNQETLTPPPQEPQGEDELCANERQELFNLGDGRAVQSNPGGRFHGWLFHQHPDGQWISERKLPVLDVPWPFGTISHIVKDTPTPKAMEGEEDGAKTSIASDCADRPNDDRVPHTLASTLTPSPMQGIGELVKRLRQRYWASGSCHEFVDNERAEAAAALEGQINYIRAADQHVEALVEERHQAQETIAALRSALEKIRDLPVSLSAHSIASAALGPCNSGGK